MIRTNTLGSASSIPQNSRLGHCMPDNTTLMLFPPIGIIPKRRLRKKTTSPIAHSVSSQNSIIRDISTTSHIIKISNQLNSQHELLHPVTPRDPALAVDLDNGLISHASATTKHQREYCTGEYFKQVFTPRDPVICKTVDLDNGKEYFNPRDPVFLDTVDLDNGTRSSKKSASKTISDAVNHRYGKKALNQRTKTTFSTPHCGRIFAKTLYK